MLYRYGIYYLLIILFAVLIYFSIRDRRKFIVRASKRTWVLALIIFIVGLSIRLALPHYHIMYIDEPWYLEMAKNMNLGKGPVICNTPDNCFMPIKAPVWPFMISIVQRLFGLNNYAVMYFNSIVGSLSIIFVYILAMKLFNNEKKALLSALIFSLMPVQIIWSNTAETNSISVFFLLLVFITYLPKRKISTLFIVCSVIMVLSRIELALILPLILFRLPRILYWLYLVIAIITENIMVRLLFGFRLFFEDIALNLMPFISDITISGLLAIPFIFGFIMRKKSNSQLIQIFFLSFILFLPLARQSRYALVPGLLLILLASHYTLELLPQKYIMVSLLLIPICAVNYTFAQQDIQARFDYSIKETYSSVEAGRLLEGKVVVAEYPTVINSITYAKIYSANALNSGGLNVTEFYYYCDMFCNPESIEGYGIIGIQNAGAFKIYHLFGPKTSSWN